jgi:hypothetical protein
MKAYALVYKDGKVATRDGKTSRIYQTRARAENAKKYNPGTEILELSTINEDTSDGYHSFKELYEFRKLYNAAFFNMLWKSRDPSFGVHKSLRHNNGGRCFGGGWFIVMAYLNGRQISNHYEMKDWDLFRIPEQDRADEWDGHSAEDVATRLHEFLRSR